MALTCSHWPDSPTLLRLVGMLLLLVRWPYSALIGQIGLLCSDWSDGPTHLCLVRCSHCTLLGDMAQSDVTGLYAVAIGQMVPLYPDYSDGPALL